jgi:hypothetical protein
VKNSAVMPDVVSGWWKVDCGDVSHEPMNASRSVTESLLVCVHGDLRNIQNGYVLVYTSQQVVNEGGLSATYINDCRASGRDSLDERKRSLKVRAVPTYLVRCFLRVDLLPVRLSIHRKYRFVWHVQALTMI